MQPRPTSDPQRDSRETSRIAVTTLERRIAELEQLTDSQSRELRIQFERIAEQPGSPALCRGSPQRSWCPVYERRVERCP